MSSLSQFAAPVGTTTIYQRVAVPGTSSGTAGDREGMVAFDDTFYYYCTANYTIGSIPIWERIASDATEW